MSMEKRDVALALSSGGARGLAHIGAIEVLKEQGYNITSIAGCSMGALIGGVYAAGKLEDFREWMKTVNKKKMLELTDFSLSINHLVKGNRIIEAVPLRMGRADPVLLRKRKFKNVCIYKMGEVSKQL